MSEIHLGGPAVVPYDGSKITLTQCSDCGNLYSNLVLHKMTDAHKNSQ